MGNSKQLKEFRLQDPKSNHYSLQIQNNTRNSDSKAFNHHALFGKCPTTHAKHNVFVFAFKEYDYESASDRIFLRHFHKNALKSKLDIEKYNHLKEAIYKLEKQLTRVNDENQLQKN